MATNINTILSWFTTGKTPTQQQFWDSWQSFWHKEEVIPLNQISHKLIKLVTTDTYTFIEEDAGYIIHFLSNIPVVAYLPAGLTENLRFEGVQVGTGQITIRRNAESAVIVRCAISEITRTLEQYSDFIIDSMGVDEYLVYGKLAKKIYENMFVSTWNTVNINTGSSSASQIKLPLTESGVYDFVVDWGDGTSSEITSHNQAEVLHEYGNSGIYTIAISGTLIGWSFGWFTGDKNKILTIESWGNFQPGDIGYTFQGCINLTLDTVKDKLNLSANTSMAYMFSKCTNLITINLIEQWDTSTINNMEGVFWQSPKFNQSLNGWNTSNVTNMRGMLREADNFNSSIDLWNVSKVTDMSFMFYLSYNFNKPLSTWNTESLKSSASMFRGSAAKAMIFNQNIDDWDVKNVTTMTYMFAFNPVFNQPLNSWDVSNVIILDQMFRDCPSFNQPLNNWNTLNVTSMAAMFYACTNFNGDVTTFNTSKVTSISSIFSFCHAFNQNVNNWDTSNVTTMQLAFNDCFVFDQPLNNWNTSKVTNMAAMFQNAKIFNQPLNNWDTSKNTIMESMFSGAYLFNQNLNSWNVQNVSSMLVAFNMCINFNYPLDNWNVANVNNMGGMFLNATAFNQDISSWAVSNVAQWTDFMAGKTDSNYSTAYYDALLLSWGSQNVVPGVSINFGSIKYTAAGETGRNLLISTKQWNITDGGLS